jgi:hypothetical protein
MAGEEVLLLGTYIVPCFVYAGFSPAPTPYYAFLEGFSFIIA